MHNPKLLSAAVGGARRSSTLLSRRLPASDLPQPPAHCTHDAPLPSTLINANSLSNLLLAPTAKVVLLPKLPPSASHHALASIRQRQSSHARQVRFRILVYAERMVQHCAITALNPVCYANC